MTHVLGHTIVPDLAADISGLCSIFVEMANISTKPSSRDDGIVARLAISTNMLHEPDGPQVRFPGAVRFEMLIES